MSQESLDDAIKLVEYDWLPLVPRQTSRRCIPSLLRYVVASLPALLLEEGGLAPASS